MTTPLTLPSAAQLSLVRLYVDRHRMHGWHRFVVVRAPRRQRVLLLHTTQLRQLVLSVAVLDHAEPQPLDPPALLRQLCQRRRELAGHKIAGALAEAVILRLAATLPPDVRPLPRFLRQAAEARPPAPSRQIGGNAAGAPGAPFDRFGGNAAGARP